MFDINESEVVLEIERKNGIFIYSNLHIQVGKHENLERRLDLLQLDILEHERGYLVKLHMGVHSSDDDLPNLVKIWL